jgi:hypothetical protein
MERGAVDDLINPWGLALFQTLQTADPQSPTEQAAFSKWLDQTTDRQQGRTDRIHGAEGVIPRAVWIGLFFMAAVVFVFMLFFADRNERWFVQALQVGTVALVITTTLFVIRVLDSPFDPGAGGLRPAAMERTVRIMDQGRVLLHTTGPLPCDQTGRPLPAA